MITPRFERDEATGLYTWPVLLNGDWSQWTSEPCALLFGDTWGWGWSTNEPALDHLSKLLHSGEWPGVTVFRVGLGSFLIFAPSYSSEQALLLAEHINRELRQFTVSSAPRSNTLDRETVLTWGIALADEPDWNLARALHAAVAPVEQAIREKRIGSINDANKGWHRVERDDFWVCSRRDLMTELKVWQRTVALCSHYADEPVALLLGDVDCCKKFNDIHGHVMGDVMLQMVAHVLRRFESNDVAVFRIGGDEFAVWMRGHSLERAKRLAEQINAQIRELQVPTTHLDAPVESVSLTWGVVGTSPRETELQTMLRKADELLDHAKCERRGSVTAQRL